MFRVVLHLIYPSFIAQLGFLSLTNILVHIICNIKPYCQANHTVTSFISHGNEAAAAYYKLGSWLLYIRYIFKKIFKPVTSMFVTLVKPVLRVYRAANMAMTLTAKLLLP